VEVIPEEDCQNQCEISKRFRKEKIAMKKIAGFVLLVSLFGTAVIAIPLCDYYYPGLKTDIPNLEMDFSLSYHNDADSAQGVGSGELKVDYTRFFDSPNLGSDLFAKNDIVLNPFSFSMAAGGNIKYFFSPDKDFFGFAGADGRISSSYQTIGLEIRIGLGYGRFVDVTALAKIMRIIAYLLEREVISENPSDAEITSIAYEIANLPLTYHNSVTGLVNVIQAMIERSNSMKDAKIQEEDIQRIRDIIEDKTFVRYCGGDIKAGIGYEISDPLKEPNDFLITASLNYALTTTSWITFTTTSCNQFLVQASISGPYDILQNRQIKFALDYDRILSEEIRMSSSYSFAQETAEGTSMNSHCVSFRLIWVLTEKAHLTLGMRFSYEQPYNQWSTDIGLFLGMDLL